MAESLRDQLLKSGIVKKVQPDRGREPKRPAGKPPAAPARSRTAQEIDLAKAYALRGQAEARERKQAEREAAEQARLRRERKLRIQQLLDGKALNKADADLVRNFEYAGKIRRIHVDAAQLAALNAGELGVVQHAGRYLLVGRDTAEQLRELDANHVALLVAPGGAGMDDDGVPHDLMW
ncbi:DUF2058 domain-containing protein [Rhodanobacter lindaniclasticus]|jgi:uncharacterized protein YaiL (DUF2058 family)|uniref:Nucleoprotein/polynucleotide-associated enzyme n=1 Tax=Rhodanobacter lindaniclasticus TaxID=75310 RepID=A0A4S3KDQ2_9GAMM|nr:DUF2058 family protein [Rhodanobacter lindaniclasticus]THD06633.1 nucleoprotein/polynucleotide-associated enzyme [Rhodanobacter lindaniclasticus]